MKIEYKGEKLVEIRESISPRILLLNQFSFYFYYLSKNALQTFTDEKICNPQTLCGSAVRALAFDCSKSNFSNAINDSGSSAIVKLYM